MHSVAILGIVFSYEMFKFSFSGIDGVKSKENQVGM